VIAVVSFPEDPHAQRVMEHLRDAGQEVFLLDLAELPDRATLTVDYDHGHGRTIELARDGQPLLDLAGVTAIWWRRPQSVDPSTVTDPEVRLFTMNEWQEAINGLWQLLDVRWVNDPVRDDVAARKPLQLRVATGVGLRVPRTLITSDPTRAAAFIATEGVGNTIFKSFSCTHAIWRETRLVRDDVLALLDAVRLAPVIFQEYVPADVDLRVTVVGERLFPAAIHSQDTDYPVDFRMSLGQALVEPATLPAEVEEALLALMQRLGLAYGAIDLRRTPEGEHVFLEVNTAGEFLFIEERTGQAIARALADLLATPA
jgi:glutathione synthase/RimK-type ligase-like ATP-grasp enzyme